MNLDKRVNEINHHLNLTKAFSEQYSHIQTLRKYFD